MNPLSVPELFTPHKIELPAKYQTDPLLTPCDAPVPVITDPLKDNMFLSALICNLLVLSPAQDDTAITKL
ncbi:MAG: hypothetical protein EZS28_000752 [Streblomastix strix]|uniref:Uncharacterized protein n=1 Tax=Streblomastix strix TaxID=222440 RepID=A0A5J4X9H7_9EUKA|nr:MAG: hypothetical protein EZS28_000752 [Streblomastix strix]